MDFYFVYFTLRQHHGWSLTEIDNLFPYERELFADLIKAEMDKKEQST
jgi:hypothetical protein